VITLSVLVPSMGRPTLQRTIDSILPQLNMADQLLIDINGDCPWGGAARNRMMNAADGDAICFMDDDDIYLPDAFKTIRVRFAEAPTRVHIFKMRYADGRELWIDEHVYEGNVSTQMVVVPNEATPGWTDRYQGDLDFIIHACEQLGDPVWHPEVIALIRPQ
jgi:glycosyltransferase involved in cell wall biosynthesis